MTREELVARLEGGEVGPEIDAALEEWAHADFFAKCTKVPDTSREIGYRWEHPIDGIITAPERYTTSLDAALALVTWILPGVEWEMTNLYGISRVTLGLNDNRGPWYGSCEIDDEPSRTARAFLIALLKAEG